MAPVREVWSRLRRIQAGHHVGVPRIPSPRFLNSNPCCSLSPSVCFSRESNKVFEGIDIEENLKKELLSNIERRLTPQAVKIRGDVELTCFSYDGIDGIIAALKAAEAESTADIEIKVKLVAAPLYVMTTQSYNKQLGVEVMEKALAKMDAKIKEHGGNIIVKVKVRTLCLTTPLCCPLLLSHPLCFLFFLFNISPALSARRMTRISRLSW